MEQNIQIIIDLVSGNSNFSAEEKAAIITKLKDTDTKIGITEFELDRAEKVKHTTAILLEKTITELEQKRKVAEAQNRELEIESSLERVRAVALSMNKPDDMLHVCRVISEQLQYLDVQEIRNVQTAIFYETKDTYINYEFYAKHNKTLVTEVDYKNHPVQKGFSDQMLKGPNEIFIHSFNGKEVQDWYEFQAGTNVFLDTCLKTADSLNYYWYSLGPVALGISTYKPLSEEETNLFKRFVKVFELSYRRYLDIEKAEAQARDAKIEAALERTRTQSMIMQHSDELDETLRVFHRQVSSLGIHSAFSFLWLPDEENDRHIFWAAWEENKNGLTAFKSKATNYPLDRNEPATAQCLIDWKSNESVYSYHVPPAVVENYFAAWKELIDGVEQLKPEYFSGGLYYVEAFMKYGCFGVMVADDLTENEKKILGRFAIEFERTYTRFLDLQKAEAQVRESQIEAALEKVRSRSLAMHKSGELQEVITVVFEKLKELGVGLDAAGATICTFIEDSRDVVHWLASPDFSLSQSYKVPYFDHPVMADTWKSRENGEDFFSKTYFPEEKNSFHKYLFDHSDYKFIPDELKNRVFASENYTLSVAGQKNSAITIYSFNNILPSEKDVETLKRFSKVFEQAYTRFLDLQKAEAQAREAQIEAALERVRSRSMGMQKSEELRDVIQVIFEQFIHLNFNIDTAGFNIDFRASDDWNLWMADRIAPFPNKIHIPYFDHPLTNAIIKAKNKGDELLALQLTFEERNSMFDNVFKYIAIPEEAKEAFYGVPGFVISEVLLKDVALYIENYAGIPYTDAENATLIRFAKVFEQTYIRFNDLKKAEAQAREATRQASLDRVRGQIASMRSTEDLQRITPLMWHELTMLEVPFIRCGVLIIDEEKSEAHIYLSSPDGHSLAAMNLPLQSNTLTARSVEYWRKGLVYTEHWGKEDFVHWMQSMIAQGQVQNPEIYQGSAKVPESLHLHFVPFGQGMLYVGNTTLLTNDEVDLVKSLGEAFSIAYARYEDFIKLAKAKQSIEVTLSELKDTQAQLIQSEKMASLGELTAGIAHEIQNPLNFVNNFSELNKELLAELNEEIGKGNYEEVKIIANDVADNEEKINHHGKRADAIVKGMLQHSRTSGGQKEPIDINVLADEYLRLAYHGLRAKDKFFNATMKTGYDKTLEKVNVIPQDISRVILNLITNAFYAIHEKAKQQAIGLPALPAGQAGYEPTISISTKKLADKIFISVKDNGNGIPQKVVDKIFQPFFTTKPTGQGTGLGLSLSYDIMKAHGGEIKVQTKEGEGSEFIIVLPLL